MISYLHGCTIALQHKQQQQLQITKPELFNLLLKQ